MCKKKDFSRVVYGFTNVGSRSHVFSNLQQIIFFFINKSKNKYFLLTIFHKATFKQIIFWDQFEFITSHKLFSKCFFF